MNHPVAIGAKQPEVAHAGHEILRLVHEMGRDAKAAMRVTRQRAGALAADDHRREGRCIACHRAGTRQGTPYSDPPASGSGGFALSIFWPGLSSGRARQSVSSECAGGVLPRAF
jgi:hypothetical protein